MTFWHDLVTDKSFYTLQSLRKEYDFVLIGGWAVFLYTQSLKSKDINIIVNAETLGRLKINFEVIKNERLKKYEIKFDSFDVDIYLSFWSELGLPLDLIMGNSISLDGFRLPPKEILLILKLFTHTQRKGSLKGQKDVLDIFSLLYYADQIDFDKFSCILKDQHLENLKGELAEIFNSVIEIKELSINKKQYADFKKIIMKNLK